MNTHPKNKDSLSLNLLSGGNSPDAKPLGVLTALDINPSVIASAPLPHLRWIAWTLEAAGYTVVLQAWEFPPGGNFVLYMQRAMTGTKQTIAVLSENYGLALSNFYSPLPYYQAVLLMNGALSPIVAIVQRSQIRKLFINVKISW
jgi:hypothetical protein